MRVRVLKKVSAYWNYAITEFPEGSEHVGELAHHLADNAPKGAVEIVEADPEPVSAPEPPADPEQGGDDSDPPVDGTIDDLMAWVDGDTDRARRALEAEQAKDKPRSTVVKRLSALVGVEE